MDASALCICMQSADLSDCKDIDIFLEKEQKGNKLTLFAEIIRHAGVIPYGDVRHFTS